MEDLRLEGVSKVFGAVTAVSDVSLVATPGTFLALLGPSGCGKTTTLSMIAGFEDPTAGGIWIRGRRVDALPPERRHTGMVFQNYALFPHMTVAANVAFGLRMKGVSRSAREDGVRRILGLVRMSGFEERYPRQLSGGQQQRVALARALIVEPAILLLDEPFGALDRQLRDEMQIELKTLQRSVGITTVFVTHDQEEALSMSDQVAVMHRGRLEQLGPPTGIYERPETRFVAGFIGKSNWFEGGAVGVVDGLLTIQTAFGRLLALPVEPPLSPGQAVEACVRPEKTRLAPVRLAARANAVPGRVLGVAYQGATTQVHVEVAAGRTLLVSQSSTPGLPCAAGDAVCVGWDPADTMVFADGKARRVAPAVECSAIASSRG